MKNGEIITINGKRFEIKKNLEVGDAIAWDIEDAYVRPSHIKRAIWADWVKWADEIHELNDPTATACLKITGKNSCTFTIGGAVHIDGKSYIFKITKEHRYIREIA